MKLLPTEHSQLRGPSAQTPKLIFILALLLLVSVSFAIANCPPSYNNVQIFNISSGLSTNYTNVSGWQMPLNVNINDPYNGSDLVVQENSSGSFVTAGYYRVGTLNGTMSLDATKWVNWTNGTGGSNSSGTVVVNMTKLIAGTNKSQVQFCFNTANSFSDNSSYLNVFPLFDDFTGVSLNSTIWGTTCGSSGSPTVSGGTVKFPSGGGSGSYALSATLYGNGYAFVARDNITLVSGTEKYATVGFSDACALSGEFASTFWGYNTNSPGYWDSGGITNYAHDVLTISQRTLLSGNNNMSILINHETSLPASSTTQELFYENGSNSVNYTTSGNIPSNAQGAILGMVGTVGAAHQIDWAYVTSDALPYPTAIATYSVSPVSTKPYLTPSTAYYNTVINGLVNVNSSMNATAVNWTLNVNGTNYSSGNSTNGSLGFYPNVNASIFNLSGFSKNSNLTLGVAAVLSDNSVLSYSNSLNLTISNSPIQLDNLKITPNSTTSTIYTGTPIYGNFTFEDNDTLTDYPLLINYSWYRNGVNQTSSAGQIFAYNGTPNWTPAYNGTQAAGDSIIFGVVGTDGTLFTPATNTASTVISSIITNLTMNSTTQEYDLYSYSHGLNFTSAPGMTINSVSAGYGGSFFAGTLTSSSGGAQQWNISIQPPFSSSTNNYTVSFIILGTYANGSTFSQTNTSVYNITVNASGIGTCNATWNVLSINYSFLDQVTLVPLNATLAAVYLITSANNSIKTTTFSAQNNTLGVCIGPSTFNSSVVASETVNASGYQTNSLTRPPQYYNSAYINRTIYLLNTSTQTSVTIVVYDINGQIISNYTVLLYQYYPATNTYILTNAGPTNTLGIVTFFVSTAPTQYALAVLDQNSILQINTTSIIFCTNLPAGQACSYAVYIGTPVTPNYYNAPSTVPGGPQSIYNTTTGTNTIDAAVGPFCSFNSTNLLLTCLFTAASTDTNFLGTNLTLYNVTNGNNQTQYSSVQSVATTQTLTVPNITGNYNYIFYSANLNTSFSYVLAYTQLLESGYININAPVANRYGTDGWILALIMVLGISFATYRMPVIFVISTSAVILMTSIMGLITLSIYTQMFILLLGLGVAYYVRD